MGIQPSNSFTLNPPFEPGTAGRLQGSANVVGGKETTVLRAEADSQRDKCVEIGVLAEFLVKLWVGQDKLAETFQVIRVKFHEF